MAVKCPKCSTDNPDTVKFCGECGTPIPDSARTSGAPTRTLRARLQEMTTGTTFAGRYQVIEELGRGGMGEVYKVLDPIGGRAFSTHFPLSDVWGSGSRRRRWGRAKPP